MPTKRRRSSAAKPAAETAAEPAPQTGDQEPQLKKQHTETEQPAPAPDQSSLEPSAAAPRKRRAPAAKSAASTAAADAASATGVVAAPAPKKRATRKPTKKQLAEAAALAEEQAKQQLSTADVQEAKQSEPSLPAKPTSTPAPVPAPPPPPAAKGAPAPPVSAPARVPAPPPPNPQLTAFIGLDDADIQSGYDDIPLTLRMLVTSTFGSTLDAAADPVVAQLVGTEDGPQHLVNGIFVSPQEPGSPERVVAVSGTRRALARAVSSLAEYNAVRSALASVGIVNLDAKDTAGAHSGDLAAKLVAGRVSSWPLDAKQDSRHELDDLVQETGVQLTLLIPEYIIIQKKLLLPPPSSLRQLQSKDKFQALRKPQSLLEEIGVLTNTQFHFPRSPILATLPMSSDYPIRIMAKSTRSLERAVRVLLTQTLLEGHRGGKSTRSEDATGASKQVLEAVAAAKRKKRKREKRHQKDKKKTGGGSARVEDADDEDDLGDSGDEYAHGRAAVPPHATYTPIPVAGVYGHPDTFQPQYLNTILEPLNPYHHPPNPSTLVAEAAAAATAAEAAAAAAATEAATQDASSMSDYAGGDGGAKGSGVMREVGFNNTTMSVNSAGQVTQYMYIPDELVGAIIGKQGAKINEIRQASGSTIKINEQAEDELDAQERGGGGDVTVAAGDRKVTIVGTPETNQRAMTLLYQRVEAEKRHHQHQTQQNQYYGNQQSHGQAQKSQGYSQNYRR